MCSNNQWVEGDNDSPPPLTVPVHTAQAALGQWCCWDLPLLLAQVPLIDCHNLQDLPHNPTHLAQPVFCVGLILPWCRTWHYFLLNFMKHLSVPSSSLPKSIWVTSSRASEPTGPPICCHLQTRQKCISKQPLQAWLPAFSRDAHYFINAFYLGVYSVFHPKSSFPLDYGCTPTCRFHICFVPDVFILMCSPCDVFHPVPLCSTSCASSGGASGCQRQHSCPRRSSHTRSVRGSCPQQHKRCQRSMEAQCKWSPSLARLSIGTPCVYVCRQRIENQQVVCAGMWSAGHSNRITSSLCFRVI